MAKRTRSASVADVDTETLDSPHSLRGDRDQPETPLELPVRRLEVTRVPIASLHPDPANARTHGPENLDAIVASLQRFGQAEPLVVQRGTRRIVAGHGRLTAMQKLGWTECDVVELDVSDLEACALGIALNRSSELGTWDEATLASLLQELRAEDALEGVGFSDAQIDELLASMGHGIESSGDVEDEGPEAPPLNPVSRLGDLWIVGDHRLLCGDSTKRDDVSRLMAGDIAALWATDAPYGVDYTGADRPGKDGKNSSGKDWSHVYHEIDIPDFEKFLDDVFTAALPVVEDHAGIYHWHADRRQPLLAKIFEKHGVLYHQTLIWVKPCATFGHSMYRWRHEPCAFGWKKGFKPEHGIAQFESVWECDWEGKQRVVGNEHPTQKATRLFEIPMEVHTKKGDICLETFSGSGTQLIAGEKLQRRVRALEIEPTFVDVGVRRWMKATGRHATLDGIGKTFEEIAVDRGVEIPS